MIKAHLLHVRQRPLIARVGEIRSEIIESGSHGSERPRPPGIGSHRLKLGVQQRPFKTPTIDGTSADFEIDLYVHIRRARVVMDHPDERTLSCFPCGPAARNLIDHGSPRTDARQPLPP